MYKKEHRLLNIGVSIMMLVIITWLIISFINENQKKQREEKSSSSEFILSKNDDLNFSETEIVNDIEFDCAYKTVNLYDNNKYFKDAITCMGNNKISENFKNKLYCVITTYNEIDLMALKLINKSEQDKQYLFINRYNECMEDENNEDENNIDLERIDISKIYFIWPSTKNSFTTDENFITIRWKILTKWISYITVDDYKLKSFDWNTWIYHVSTSNNELKVWTNIYEFKYYDNSWKIIYKNNYTIIKTN